MTAAERRAFIELHIAVLLFGLTAILGDLIQLTALLIVWWRVLITSVSLAPWAKLRQLSRDIPRVMIRRYVGIGVLVALHWLTFYGSIKLANASIALVCMATTSFFTAFLEPLIVKRAFRWYEMVMGLLIIPGMALVVSNIQGGMVLGMITGLSSAFLAATFGTLNKKYIDESDPIRITFIELSSSWVFLSIVLVVMLVTGQPTGPWWAPSWTDWLYLLILALLCTSLAYVLSLRALAHISAFAANLTINMEPVYGIVLAWLLLNEHQELGTGFYYGVVVIMVTVFSYPLVRKWAMRRGW